MRYFLLIIVGISLGTILAEVYTKSPQLFGIKKENTNMYSKQLLSEPWQAHGDKSLSETTVPVNPGDFKYNNLVRITYNSYGQCLLEGKAASIAFESKDNYHPVALADYGKNCLEKEQSVDIPLQHFADESVLKSIDSLRISFWFSSNYKVDVKSILLTQGDITKITVTPGKKVKISQIRTVRPVFVLRSTTKKDITPSVTQTIEKKTPAYWPIQSVSSMKETKDKICNQDTEEFITQWVDKAKKLGVTYISLETPYDNPQCGDALAYTKTWIRIIRSRGLSIWHRHMPVTFEGIYNSKKLDGVDYLAQIKKYIIDNKEDFQQNDIFTPIPEPQNGGIAGITHCTHDVCQFADPAQFNRWLRSAMDVTENTFAEIGLKDQINIGFFGFDGFIAWGDNNPDWDGILEDETIERMGNITIDHYPEVVGSTMEEDLNELQALYPNVPIVIGEWGTIGEGNLKEQVKSAMSAAKRPNVIGFNYWNLGIGNNESLINEDFSEREHFATVQSFFEGKL